MTPRPLEANEERVVFRRRTRIGRELRVALVPSMGGESFSVQIERHNAPNERPRCLRIFLTPEDATAIASALAEGRALYAFPTRRSSR